MKHIHKLALWSFGALVALVAFSSQAKAASTAAIDIHVSINATKALTVNASHYNYGALAVNTSSVTAVAIQVDNTSGALFQTYTIQGANAPSATGGTTWNIVASTGTVDEYVLKAQFSTAAPDVLDSNWANDTLTTSPIVCTAGTLGNTDGAQSGAAVTPNTAANANRRYLWFRLTTPLFVSDTTQRDVTVTVAVQ